MKKKVFRERYFSLLKSYIDDVQEAQLAAAAELGRRLFQADIPIEDIVEIHEEALSELAEEFPAMRLLETADRISKPLMEVLITYGLSFRERRRLERDLEESHRRLQGFNAYLQAAIERERTRIAREMHDQLGQDLTALKMDIAWLKKKLPGRTRPVEEKLRSMSELTGRTIGEVKRLCTDLRPAVLDGLGLSEAVEWQAADFEKRTGIRCRITVVPEQIDLEGDYTTTVFRIFQEILTNVSRHAGADEVEVVLIEKEGWVRLKVKDNGRGIPEEQISNPQSFGLIGIQERVRLINGNVRIRGVRNGGTTVEVTIPLGGRGGAVPGAG